ncbi:MAG TPA: hypothetical protein VN954_16080 [Ktedonobacteraceae bacterium]|nr:hypothetical protein [Ktedonobacteraceae bacterium]
MFRFRLQLLILFAIVALSGCSSSPILTPTPATTLTASATQATLLPTPTPTGRASLTPGGTGTIKAAITSFYQAIEAQNYTLAYSYLDANATIADGQKLTQQMFTQLAQSRDKQFGPVTGFDLLINSSDRTQVIMTIARESGFRYHAHLQVKQVGNAWKILTLDRI